MRRPREAVDTTMLAAAIGIDRLLKGDVRRLVACDDAARGVIEHLGAQRRRRKVVVPPAIVPAVVDENTGVRLVAAGSVGERAAPGQTPRIGGEIKNRRHDSEDKTGMRT